jgi:hypothetical protein
MYLLTYYTLRFATLYKELGKVICINIVFVIQGSVTGFVFTTWRFCHVLRNPPPPMNGHFSCLVEVEKNLRLISVLSINNHNFYKHNIINIDIIISIMVLFCFFV